jgi:hypothetical protein
MPLTQLGRSCRISARVAKRPRTEVGETPPWGRPTAPFASRRQNVLCLQSVARAPTRDRYQRPFRNRSENNIASLLTFAHVLVRAGYRPNGGFWHAF